MFISKYKILRNEHMLFYIAHCPYDEQSRRILNICLTAIQKHYPEADTVVLYSESNLELQVDASHHVRVEKSPIPNSSVVGCFKHYLDSGEQRKAIFMHDSIILKGRFREERLAAPFGFIWEFKQYSDLKSIECKDIRETVFQHLMEYPDLEWLGCFGCCLFSTRENLQTLWGLIDFPSYAAHPQRAQALMDLERVIGVYSYAAGLHPVALCGSIFTAPRAFERWYTDQTLEDIEAMPYEEAAIKAWMNRFIRKT